MKSCTTKTKLQCSGTIGFIEEQAMSVVSLVRPVE